MSDHSPEPTPEPGPEPTPASSSPASNTGAEARTEPHATHAGNGAPGPGPGPEPGPGDEPTPNLIKRFGRALGRTFFKGLVIILPFVVTLYVIYWVLAGLEKMIAPALRWLLPDETYWPGMGVALAVALVLAVGMFANAIFIRSLIQLTERIFERVPLARTIYGAVRDFFSYFSNSQRQAMNKVVMAEWEQKRIMGLVTRETFDDLPEGVAQEGQVAVYFPMSYQLGGYTVMVPRERLTPLDLSFDEAMKFLLTAGVTAQPDAATSTGK